MSGEEFPCKQKTYDIIGACFEVYNEKGCGFLEPVYQECLAFELGIQSIPFEAQVELVLDYKGHPLKQTYRPDFICFGEIVLEIKAVSALADGHRAQLINYLHATGREVGLLVNFGHHARVEYERLVNSHTTHSRDADPSNEEHSHPPHLRRSALSAGEI
jgi:GxxExxY protein